MIQMYGALAYDKVVATPVSGRNGEFLFRVVVNVVEGKRDVEIAVDYQVGSFASRSAAG